MTYYIVVRGGIFSWLAVTRVASEALEDPVQARIAGIQHDENPPGVLVASDLVVAEVGQVTPGERRCDNLEGNERSKQELAG